MSAWPRPSKTAWPPSPDRWRLDYEVDFRGEATQTISSSPVTIAGKSWTVVNVGNADVFAVTNGTGLQIGPATGTQYAQATKDAPYLKIDLDELVAKYDRADRLFIQLRVATVGLSADYQSYGLVVGGAKGDGNDAAMLENQYNGGTVVRSARFGGAEWNLDSGSAEAGFLGMEVRPLYASTWHSATANAWPRPSEMTQASKAFVLFNSGPLASAGWHGTSSMNLRLFAERNNGAGAYTAVIEGLRILRQLQ